MRVATGCVISIVLVLLASCKGKAPAIVTEQRHDGTSAWSCDKRAAKATLDSGEDIADVDTTNGITTWRIEQRSWPPIMGNPQAFVRKVADADACLHQPPLHIVIRDPDGKFLGETGPAGTHIN